MKEKIICLISKIIFTIIWHYVILAKSLNEGIRESSDGQLCFWRKLIRRKSMQTKKEIIDAYKKSENDTGSAEVQFALLTERINHLTDPVKPTPNANHSRRGLLQLVGQ